MAHYAPNSLDDELRYLSDVQTREDELRRLNEELDQQLEFVENTPVAPISLHKVPASRIYAAPPPPLNNSTLSNLNETVDTTETDATHETMESPLPIRTIRDRTDDPAVPLFSPSTDAGSVPTDSAPSPNDPDPAIGAAAQLRFQKARIKAQALQLTDAMAMKIDAEKTAANATKKLKVTAEEKIRLNKSMAELKSQLEKLKAKTGSDKDIIDGLKRENAALKKDLTVSNKINEGAQREHKGREIRLARALEECDKFKETLSKATQETAGSTVGFRKEKDRLVAQVRSLERQRAELLTAFKKQMKLIEIMKRMKVHTEAAKLLEFTEEEFVKVLDWEA